MYQLSLFTRIRDLSSNATSLHALTSMGQRSDSHPHVTSHYFQDVNGVMCIWIQMTTAEYRRVAAFRHTHTNVCPVTNPPTKPAGDYQGGGDGHWTIWSIPPSCCIHDDLSNDPSSYPPLTHTHTRTQTHTPSSASLGVQPVAPSNWGPFNLGTVSIFASSHLQSIMLIQHINKC